MNLDSLTAALSHIGYLINSLSKKTICSGVQEIKEILNVFGEEAEVHLFRTVLNLAEWSTLPVDSKDVPIHPSDSLNFGSSAEDLVPLIQQVSSFIPLQRFSALLALSIATPINSKVIRPNWVSGVLNLLKLSKVQEIIILFHLHQNSNSEIHNQALTLLKLKLSELLECYIQAETGRQELSDFSTEVLHFILVQESESVFTPELKEEFLTALRKEYPREQTPLVLLPILYPQSDPVIEKPNVDSFSNMAKYLMYNLADYVSEIGYSFCSSVEECKTNLVNFGEQGITPGAVARVVGLMVKTHSSLQPEQHALPNLNETSSLWGDSKDKTVGTPSRNQSGNSSESTSALSSGASLTGGWNVEVFIKALVEVSSSINVRAVTTKLDYKGFIVADKKGLQLLVNFLKCLLQEQGTRAEMFPVDCFYRQWKNTEEQLRLFEQILTNPDVFCLADYHCRMVVTEGLKAMPELDNKLTANWKSLELIELMLRLADGGQYGLVKELLKIPIQHCPDIIILGLVQSSVVYTPLKQELISSLIPIFLGNHPNGMSVLQIIWQTQKETTNVRQIMIMSMADWYMALENDQARLSKIFDVAQDLKALSLFLDAQPFVFVIDLACLAFRREYLNLEKWLDGKIRNHGEIFIISCVKFLQRRCPVLVGGKDDLLPKSTQLPQETVSTILVCLQSCAITLQQEYQDLILTMVQNLSLLNRPRQVSSLGFGSQTDALGGIASSLSNLTLGGASSSIFPPTSSSLSLSSLGALGTGGPSSPARPSLPNLSGTAVLPPTSQSSISSLLPSLQLASTPSQIHNVGAVGSQLPGASSLLSSTLTGSSLRSQSVQPAVGQRSQSDILSVDIAQIFEIPPIITKEVEDEANSYFQRIYNQPPHPTLSIEEILEMLKNFHESTNKREREVYSCMLKNLFEEYRFFPTYPNRELILTAKLFGGIIEQGLVEYIALGVALRYIVEALQKPHGSKMYYFGIVALDRFKARLKEYPRYCHHLMAIEHFNEFPAHLIEYIKYGTQSQEPPNRPSGPVLPTSMDISSTTTVVVSSSSAAVGSTTVTVGKTTAPSTVTASSTIGRPQLVPGSGKPTIATTNIETLLVATEKEEKLTPPPDHMQDKIAFIFNNLSQINLPQKCEELKEIITEEYHAWVSQYLVMKRVSIENNFHTLYSLFLDQLNLRPVTNYVQQETLRNVKVLLCADKSETNSSDKSLLKNLGHWLGMLTLAKNKPIFHMDIDVKSLLIEAYKKGLQEMQYVVPFVAKVIESCAKSRVFKPPNPWTMAIMNLMAELHKEPDMKLHLKFEIEVLCNKLEINLKDLKPSGILKNAERLSKLKSQLSQPIGKRAESTPLFSSLPGSSATPPVIPAVQSATPTPLQAPSSLTSEPRFIYNDISLSSVRCFDAHVSVSSPQVGNLETSAQLKQLVRHAVDLAVQEIITVVIERSFKVAITTTENLIKKDFALEPDDARMRAATHHMVRNLTAAMAMITSKDHLATGIAKAIKQGIISGFNRKTTPQQQEQVDQLATAMAHENIGIACAFIQKTAAEKAVQEMDKRFASEYEARKVARAEGRRYCDARAFSYQMEAMPEPIRMKVGRVSPQQSVVYEEFARNIPGFLPIVENDVPFINKPIPLTNSFTGAEDTSTFLLMAERITPELELIIQTFTGLAPTSPLIQMLHSLLEGILFHRSNRENTSAQLLVKRAVENLLEGIRELPSEPELNQLALRFRDIHIILLKAMADPRAFGPTWASKYVTKFWTESREEIRFNLEVMDWLLQSALINVEMLDEHLQRVLDEPSMNSSFTPLLFIMQLIQMSAGYGSVHCFGQWDPCIGRAFHEFLVHSSPIYYAADKVYLIDDTSGSVLNDTDLTLTLECLIRLTQNRQAPDTLRGLVESLRMKYDVICGTPTTDRLGSTSSSLSSSLVSSIARVVGNNGNAFQSTSNHHFHSGVTQARDFHDPQGLHEKTDGLLRDWIQMFHSPSAGQGSTAAFQHFVKNMDIHGILKTDEVITRFFRICITMCRDLCVRSISELGTSSPTYVRNKCFPNLDAFVRLISLLVKQSGEPSNPNAKINLLNKVLGLISGIMLHDIETHGNEFQQLPYHRILIMLFLELNAPETVLESINLPVLVAFTQTLHLLRPSKCPGFAYAWLELVSHRVFIGRMLAITPQQKGWSMYSMLLTDLFKFLAPFLRNVELSKPFTMLYKGTLRVLLVLLHDFPEFLCDYHYNFCDEIPPNCIQMRNLILSAYPRNMRLPDPFMPNLKVDRLPEISVSPKINPNIAELIQPAELKKNLDSYLKNRSNVNFLSELRSYLQVSNEPGMRYNMSLMNALVLYVGMQAIAQIQAKSLIPSMPTIAHTAHMDIFENLAVDLDTEGRYLFLIAIANQLRYPNSHTHYFSCTLLYLFSEANTEAIQEQITRVLLERLIGNRPQPWGLLITFIELIKNPSFKFWTHDFVKCAPEIEKIFESVARSCMVPKNSQPSEREQ